MSYPVWRLSMDMDVLKAHRAWLAGGKQGPGRLVLEDQDLRGARVAMPFPAARFVRCDLSEAAFPLMRLDEIELVDCKLDNAVLNSTAYERGSITGSSLVGAALQAALFQDAQLAGCKFDTADLERALLERATIEKTSFVGTRLRDTVLDDARFVSCDMRDCDLSRSNQALDLATATRTRFERCDLRGAKLAGRRLDGTVFDRCRMDGMIGKPEIEGAYSIIAPVGTTVEEIEASWR